MMCAWKELLSILPSSIRQEVDCRGKDSMQELRLRMGAPPELVLNDGSLWLEKNITKDEINFVVNTASRYSPWAASSVAQGFITAVGGHRIGLCGDAACTDGKMTGLTNIESLCIRVARDFPELAANLCWLNESVLILGPPGWGKTTLLRDLARQISYKEVTAVVDERCEVFPVGFAQGKRMHVLRTCPKSQGIEIVLRTMGPAWIAVDEITAQEDCKALIQAANCGIRLLATAHGVSLEDLYERPVYRSLIDQRIFRIILIMHKDKSWSAERMGI